MTDAARQARTAMRFRMVVAAVGVLAAVPFALSSCDRSPATLLRANQEPTLELEPLRVTGGEGARQLRVGWRGEDADGRVTHYEWSLESGAALGRETWVETHQRERTIDMAGLPLGAPAQRTLHFLSVRSVDDRGARSPVRRVGLYGDNIPPTVLLTSPPPQVFPILVLPNITFRWTGEDPDGVFTTKPVKYKYTLLSSWSEFPMELALQNPDSLRSYYVNHPLGPWAGWDSTSADTTEVRYTNLTPSAHYVFCVIAFDEAGDYSPVFSFSTNMTQIRVGFEGAFGPRIGVYNESFNYEYATGGFNLSFAIPLETPAATPITFNWYAIPGGGLEIEAYRWALDIEDILDETPRTGPDDLQHWSDWSPTVTSATVGPFTTGSLKRGRHRFYIEARDDIGIISLAQVDIVVVPAIPLPDRRELLIVDDTRFAGDRFLAGQSCPTTPSVPWPTASEVDTALYARGGMPWTCKPEGTLSPPGLFTGYPFDTLGTRGLATVPYSTLTQYRRVIWLTDQFGAAYTRLPTDPLEPITVLRSTCSPGRYNPLAAFVEEGGALWIAGGGAGLASTDPFNDLNNDAGSRVFSSISGRGELQPGRFMWDMPAWRSEFTLRIAAATFHRSLGRHEGNPLYTGLPATVQIRTQSSDPWPLRPYRTTVPIEYLTRLDNLITEDDGATSVLDTLYRATAATLPDPDPLPPNNIVMTHYRGSEHGPVTFSGFAPWDVRYSQMRPVVDFVFQQLWGMAPPSAPAVSARRE